MVQMVPARPGHQRGPTGKAAAAVTNGRLPTDAGSTNSTRGSRKTHFWAAIHSHLSEQVLTLHIGASSNVVFTHTCRYVYATLPIQVRAHTPRLR